MFIAPLLTVTRAPAERNVFGRLLKSKTFRSSGAREILESWSYKHFVPTGRGRQVLLKKTVDLSLQSE
jgi:hypothetical protein